MQRSKIGSIRACSGVLGESAVRERFMYEICTYKEKFLLERIDMLESFSVIGKIDGNCLW